MPEQTPVVPPVVPPENAGTTPEAAKDPIRVMIEIVENDKISDSDKTTLIEYAKARFTNRRRMAYTALYAIVGSLALLFVAAFIDGFSSCPNGETCERVLKSIEANQTLIAWIEGFLAAIVAAYFGVSSWRPSS